MPHVEHLSRRLLPRSAFAAMRGDRFLSERVPALWTAGTIDGLAAPAVALVGTRAPSDDGRRRARRLAADLGRAGVCVVSGLALGIDAAAHEGALDAGAPTIGVLGSGHDRFFPPRNLELARRIVAAGGAVVSPYAPGVHPRPFHFLSRNAVIAGLADAVVVIEAAARSGSLNTAGWGAQNGIPVLAFPGDVERPKAAGGNELIRDGATLVRNAADVLEALGIAPGEPAEPESPLLRDGDDPEVRRILRALEAGAAPAATLADRLGLAPPQLLPHLVELELAGRIVPRADGYALGRAQQTG